MGEINDALPVILMKPLSEARLGNVYGDQFGTGYAGNVWDSKGICPALMCMQGGGRQPHVICGVPKIRTKRLCEENPKSV